MRLRSAICTVLLICVGITPVGSAESSQAEERFDVVVYGATPGGIAAAVAAARRDSGLRIALVTPYQRVGGMITNGLTHPDFRTFEARTGLFRELNNRVLQYFVSKYGADSDQVKDSLLGTHAGPEVNFKAFSNMLDLPGITLQTNYRLKQASVQSQRIAKICLVHSPDGEERCISGRYFVDASYEGDLLAAAGVEYSVGRESRGQYGESLAPEKADGQVQGYNFRLTMTNRPANRVSVPKPPGYKPEDYAGLVELLEGGEVKRIFGDPLGGLPGGIYKRQTPKLPNGKRDINDVSHSNVRLSLPNINSAWPDGDHATRQAIFAQHIRHNIGMLFFLQNDPSVPKRFAEEAREWGLCRDELEQTAHLPEQLYVREARRMKGRYVFTQNDVERAANTNHARAVFQPDSIAMGDYGPNCHGTYHEGPLFGGRHTGEFYKRCAPYQIPFAALLPKDIENLVVPVACSSSHVG
ncbi:MAG TPA: xanthan lyase, partial [Planctomycetaceae bacterium]|nr:xanthan lyase [Planctomycetaceae bacterium]